MLKNRPPGTEILFVKVPPGNDKVPLDTTPELEAWFREPIKRMESLEWRDVITFMTQRPRNRTQFAQRLRQPCSIRAATFCYCAGRTTRNGRCTLDFGISLTCCAIREVREETGLQIRITGLIGTYTDPHILIAYNEGEVRREFTFVYAAEIDSGELKIADESKEAAWIARRLKEISDEEKRW